MIRPWEISSSAPQALPLPPQSPNVHAYAERWVRSVKEEALSRVILFGEPFLHHALKEYMAHDHAERPHQGKGNVVLMPAQPQASSVKAPFSIGNGSVGC